MRLGAATSKHCWHTKAGAAKSAMPRPAVSEAAAKRIIALDFDGVICDSVGESSLSAFKVRWHST
jgi:hypothetical protein